MEVFCIATARNLDWNLHLRRPIRNNELIELQQLIEELSLVNLNPLNADV